MPDYELLKKIFLEIGIGFKEEQFNNGNKTITIDSETDDRVYYGYGNSGSFEFDSRGNLMQMMFVGD